MRQSLPIAAFAALLTGAATLASSSPAAIAQHGARQDWRAALHAAVAAPTRTAANVGRDRYRHPYETLAFFGVRPSSTVVELWAGAGWYTEILAPYLRRGGGTLYEAAFGSNNRGIEQLMHANPDLYGGIRLAAFPVFSPGETRISDNSVDFVLTFRNVHNWRMGAGRHNEDYSAEAFRQIYRMLRPGGVLGIEDHRLPERASAERERTSGYMKVSTIRHLAEAAGFRFAGASEINANPRDTADWPQGVWTLPPTLQLGQQDRERYLAIGESDRMTLRFVKPR